MNFGLSGLPDQNYDAFIGKRARSRRKERRTRRKERREIRFEKRKLKNDDRKADTEAKRAETKVMKATMMPEATPSIQSTTAAVPIHEPPISQTENTPTLQQAGFGSNPLMIVVGVLVLGGFLLINKGGKSNKVQATAQPQ